MTIPNVELARVGTHEASTGTWVVEPSDLADAVAAAAAGVVSAPVVKLGHEGPLRDGAPALGRVRNLRTVESGTVLVGDLVDVPRTVADLMPRAWPQRSVEGYVDFTDQHSGQTFGFVMTAVALLGASMPAVAGLADINDVASLYGVAAKHVAIPSNPSTQLHRSHAVQVAAARRRRTHRTIGA
ncbi:hypothetical protein [Mycolicibacterium iranicum]|uniref:Uncharacterized protein n=1 Tax=Mycolicibacterium iranicum TaxID=912594 RepID=A0ABT4HQJ0_MYCIR|nr:hypothetical protein [Mycolicibacterium iranicum]MCZ0732319.1 hypothetical protein [Mycolicibacterium iranicum]